MEPIDGSEGSDWVTTQLQGNLFLSLLGEIEGDTYFLLHRERDKPNRSSIAMLNSEATRKFTDFVESHG